MPVLTYTSLQAKWHRLVSKLPPRREKKGSEAICKESPKTGKSDKMEEEESPGSRGNGLLAPEGEWRLNGTPGLITSSHMPVQLVQHEIPGEAEGTGTSIQHEVGVQGNITSTARLGIDTPVPSLQNNDGVPIRTVTHARVLREQIPYGGNSHSRGTYPLPHGWDRDIEMSTRRNPRGPDEALYTQIPWDVAFPHGRELCHDGPTYNGEQLPEADRPTRYVEGQCLSTRGLKSWGVGETQRLESYEQSPEMQGEACEMLPTLQSARTSRGPDRWTYIVQHTSSPWSGRRSSDCFTPNERVGGLGTEPGPVVEKNGNVRESLDKGLKPVVYRGSRAGHSSPDAPC
eukprot:GHVU01080806.1.p1 GENE.GHVU01080806.1~~GHVU01080806.1.p1  ORF type:complete len:344 (-),score=16.26 GHVU01080806.1:215-1246(-)